MSKDIRTLGLKWANTGKDNWWGRNVFYYSTVWFLKGYSYSKYRWELNYPSLTSRFIEGSSPSSFQSACPRTDLQALSSEADIKLHFSFQSCPLWYVHSNKSIQWVYKYMLENMLCVTSHAPTPDLQPLTLIRISDLYPFSMPTYAQVCVLYCPLILHYLHHCYHC